MKILDRLITGFGNLPNGDSNPAVTLIKQKAIHPSATILQWHSYPKPESLFAGDKTEKKQRNAVYHYNVNFKHSNDSTNELILTSHRKRYAQFLELISSDKSFSNVTFLLDELIEKVGQPFVFRYLAKRQDVEQKPKLESMPKSGDIAFWLFTFYVDCDTTPFDPDIEYDQQPNDFSFTPNTRNKASRSCIPDVAGRLYGLKKYIVNTLRRHIRNRKLSLSDFDGLSESDIERRLLQLGCAYYPSADFPPVVDTLFFPNCYPDLDADSGNTLDVGEMLAVSYDKRLSLSEIAAEFVIYNSHFDRLGMRKRKTELELLSLVKRHATIAAKAALFSRNFSHNIGSHALSHPAFADALGIGDEKKDAKANAKHFFHFLQHRYDWISQMVSGYAGGQSQPMLLMAEVLLPFFRQTALLTKLVADQDIAELEFEVHLPGAPGTQSFAIKKESDGLTAIHEDCYIAVPGGIVGCQALYSIIENFMRNSAKYAQRKLDKAKKMCIYLDLMEHAGEYQFQICDTAANGPKDTQTSLTDQINRVKAFSKQPLIGIDGSLVAEGRGILDMRESAKSLHPESTFKTLEVNSTLAHRFSIQKPILVSVLTKNKPTHEARLSLCHITSDSATWLAKTPTLAVVDDNGRLEPTEISKLQLPYRILVLCEESRMAIWREKLPLRAQIISGSLPAMDDEKTALLNLYETWLRAAKPAPNQSRWQLAIGIERPHGTVKEGWSQASDFKSELVDLWVYSKQTDGEDAQPVYPKSGGGWATVKEQAKSSGFFKGAQWKSWLIFDNHGNCFQPSERSLVELTPPEFPGFFSEIGGGQSSLWNRLYRPPVEPFSFAWFILSLVESATTRVLVVDERVLSFADSHPANYKALMRGGVVPIREISGSQSHLVLPIHDCTPGTRVDQQSVFSEFSDRGSELLVDFDMFVIHESISQMLATPNFAEWAKAIKQQVGWLVNSSGRGEGRSLLFGEEPLPFIGFAALAQAVYADQNKLDLVSSLACAQLPLPR